MDKKNYSYDNYNLHFAPASLYLPNGVVNNRCRNRSLSCVSEECSCKTFNVGLHLRNSFIQDVNTDNGTTIKDGPFNL